MVYASNQVFRRIDRSTLAVYRNETYLGDSCLRPGIDIPVETESDIARTVTLVEVQYGIVLSLGNPSNRNNAPKESYSQARSLQYHRLLWYSRNSAG